MTGKTCLKCGGSNIQQIQVVMTQTLTRNIGLNFDNGTEDYCEDCKMTFQQIEMES